MKIERIGKVTICNLHGSYRLRYRVDKREHVLTISGGVSDYSLLLAKKAASEITLDIATGHYDDTKAKYDVRYRRHQPAVFTDLLSLWENYVGARRSEVTHLAAWNQVSRALHKVSKQALDLRKTSLLVPELRKHYSTETVKRIGDDIRACLNWAQRHDLIVTVPRYDFYGKRRHVQRNKRSQLTFSSEEIAVIIQAFKDNSVRADSSHYANFIEFLALTGRRPEDVIALQWDDTNLTNNGRRYLVFDKAYSSGMLKSTKNGKQTLYPVNQEILDCLTKQSTLEKKHSDLVFPSRYGIYINLHNFSSRYWRPIITRLVKDGKISKYLPVYNLRHSRATHLIRNGIDLQTIAYLLETSIEMLSRHYLQGNGDIDLPNLFTASIQLESAY